MGLKTRSLIFLCLASACCFLNAENKAVKSIQPESCPFKINNHIDELMVASLKTYDATPSSLASDDVFLRRVYLDVTGMLPSPEKVRSFLNNHNPDKRKVVIDKLLKSDEFTDYLTLKWCDLLRVKSEFPINLWPNGVQAYARWIHDAVRTDMPYDKFVRALLTSSGSNFRKPAVNFYRAVQEENASGIAAATALTFMGTRIKNWDDASREEFESFFSRVKFTGTAEWKETIVCFDPAPLPPVKALFPDGRSVIIPSGTDPRIVYADWLISPDNEWFAKNIVNRMWSWLLGSGLINETDDIRPDNLPVHPEVLEYLEKELVKYDYDLRHVYRLILNSATYQQRSQLTDPASSSKELFDHYPVRRLDAEVLIDALSQISGVHHEGYYSMIPEPFTFIPDTHTSIQLVDGSISSPFLKMFGRPDRNTGLESERGNVFNEEQRLHILNSTHIQEMIDKSWRLLSVSNKRGQNPKKVLDVIYLTILSRLPTSDEYVVANKYIKTGGRQAMMDFVWSLINTKEFLYRH